MISRIGKAQIFFFLGIFFPACSPAQKVKAGYDKTADFSKYRSYTIQIAETTGRPLLYMNVVSTIKTEIESRGLTSMDRDGDLTVIANGSFDYGQDAGSLFTSDSCVNCKAPLVDPMEWTGKMAPPGAAGMGLPKGVLQLTFVDRVSNKVVWAGTVEQKLDPEKKQKSLERAHAAIKKLLMEFPPRK